MENNITIPVIIEIPKGSSNKYEYDIKTKTIHLDRVLYGANFYPGEYGFINETLDWDGDPLDVISLSTYPTTPGCIVDIRILGTMRMIDDGEIDTKLIGVVAHDPRFEQILTIQDVPPHFINEIEDFFNNYKNLQNKKVVINGIGDIEEAKNEITACRKRYFKYEDLILNGSKKELMAKLNSTQKL